VIVRRVRIIEIGPERQGLVVPLVGRCVFGTVPSPVFVGPVLLAENLGDVRGNGINDGLGVGLVQTLVQRPSGDLVRIEQAIVAGLGLVSLDVGFT